MADVTPIRRLLIANRGEIARRIIRTAHRMGIATVAVFGDDDVGAPHVREADAAMALGGASAAETYLNGERIIGAARAAGADAIHPGYGFLSENADFAQAVIDAGLTWVGPSPASIRGIGDKLAAKALARAAGVPTLEADPLGEGDDQAAAAARIGYPILIKASAGGGGRGMRVVSGPEGLAATIDSARREAQAAFGDGTVFLERYVAQARHVEIQILGDRHGGLVHLFERECSIQRRHQKIIEEAPSPAVGPALRERMGAAALLVAAAIGYHSAGTVEFLVDGDAFWFLEVNTRLQVEHPVTEAITGIDLVREQIRIAEGEALGYGQADVRISGHAIEARLCAEDPANDFLPSPGRISVWQPAEGPGLRVDDGIESGSVIGTRFDPMLAKVIAHAPTRREAAALLARGLERSRLQGITHNRDFLVATLRSPAFLAGDTTTDFLTRIAPAPSRIPGLAERRAACLAAALHERAGRIAAARVMATIPPGFRNTPMPPERARFRIGTTDHAVTYRSRRDGSLEAGFDGVAHDVRIVAADGDGIAFTLDGVRHAFRVRAEGEARYLHGTEGDITLIAHPRFAPPQQAGAGGGLRAPMPGRVLRLMVAEGSQVVAGDVLLILEAMKMEHRITAPFAGTVTALRVAEGDQVANGAALVTIAPMDEVK